MGRGRLQVGQVCWRSRAMIAFYFWISAFPRRGLAMTGDFRLGPWLVEPQRNLISTKDRKVRLEPKAMDVLAFLAEHAGEVLHKERIIACVWQGAFVGDDVLTHAISELRKALQDDTRRPRFIETIPKRGYRLAAQILQPEADTRYRIQERIGQGGMGEVHLAEDTLLKRKVALKFVLPDKGQDDKWAERLRREALAAAALDHPFICKVYEIGELGGRTFIAMEYVEGPTLADRLSQGPLPLGEALNIALEIAEALEVAHQGGIVHRDLKPSNISLTAQGHVKITDFGVAKRLVASDENAQEQQAGTLTTSMTASGTIPYMSPEQVTGRPVDPRSDIFALGVLLYEMLSAVNPFRRQLPMETAAAIQEAIPAPLAKQVPGVGQLLEHAVLRMLAKHPDQRYQSVHDVLTDLRRIENTLTGPRTPEGQKTAPRSRALATAAAAAAIVLFMGLWWYTGFYPLRQSGDKQDRQRETIPAWIAVLPFSSASDDPQQQDFIEGLGDELIVSLSKVPWLRVINPHSTSLFRDTELDIPEIAQQLSVDYIVKGTVYSPGNKLRVTAHLIDASTSIDIWSDRFERERELAKIFAIQEEILQAILTELASEIGQRSDLAQDMALAPPTTNLDAYRHFQRGRKYAKQYLEAGFARAEEEFEKAIQLDGNFARAYTGLGMLRVNKLWLAARPKDNYQEISELAGKALEINPLEAEAHTLKGFLLAFRDWEGENARREFERALELDPNSAQTRLYYSFLLSWGLFDRPLEAIEQIRLAQRLDPMDIEIQGFAGLPLRMAGKYDEAIAEMKKLIALQPDYPWAYQHLGLAYLGKLKELRRRGFPESAGEQQLMIEALEKAAELAPSMRGQPARAYYFLGETRKANEICSELIGLSEYFPPTAIAGCHMFRGDIDRAFQWIHKGLEEKDNFIFWFRYHATDELREDPRYRDYLRRINQEP